MTVLWAGAEDIDFPAGTAPTISTSAGGFRAGYARCSLLCGSSVSVLAKSHPFSGGAVTSAWVSCQAYYASAIANNRLVGLGKSGTNAFLGAVVSATTTKLGLAKYDGTTQTLLATESGTTLAPGLALYRIDLHVTSYGASAILDLYVNGSLVLTYSGDVSISGVAELDCVAFGGGNASGTSWRCSELIVADEDTRLLSLCTLAPSAAGDANAWTGAYTAIDEITNSDADTMYTDTVAQDAQVNLSNLPAGTFTIRAVKLAARVSKSAGATAGSVALGVKSGGSIDAGSDQAATTSWETKERLMTTNPVTTNNWASSEIDALQLNLRSAA